jgi:hypothetical protein
LVSHADAQDGIGIAFVILLFGKFEDLICIAGP